MSCQICAQFLGLYLHCSSGHMVDNASISINCDDFKMTHDTLKKTIPDENDKITSKKENKHCARIVKCGMTKYGKQKYSVKYNGERIKQSVYPDKLVNWFINNYPLEIIKSR